MHAYATNCPHQIKLIAWMGILSVSIAGITSWVLVQIGTMLGWSLTAGGLSSIVVFSILWWIADNKAWKWKRARSILLVPDLNGIWECKGLTISKSGEDAGWDWNAKICIVQSWSKISITLKTSQSDSKSIAASLQKQTGQGYRLIYHYDNSPKPTEGELARHSGLADLMFSEDENRAEGQYFTDRDRMTYGSMRLTRIGDSNEQTQKT